ncbi:MAG: ketoacyl-ACP synthase III [Vulcanimicrobiaceae bacterium]
MQPIVSAPAHIAAVGMYVPQRVLSNADFEKMMDTNDEWIVQRTGIRNRHVVGEGEYASHMAFGAIDDLLRNYPSVRLEDVGYIIVASSTTDYFYPSLSAMVQAHYRLPKTVGAIDISTACAGFAYGINLASALVGTRQTGSVLIVAADALTRSVNYEDRSTAVLFGDGGGAAIVEYSEQPKIFGMDAGSDGTGGRFLYRVNMRREINGKEADPRFLHQDGRDVYRWVMENIPATVRRILSRAGMTLDDVDWFAPHSANLRMIEALDKRLDFPMDRTLLSIEEYGNTSAVSIPLALVTAVRDGRVKPGDKILVVGFGGGLVTAGSVVVWG